MGTWVAVRTYLTRGSSIRPMTAAVLSVEQLSDTTTSTSPKLCFKTDRTAYATRCPRLYVGITTLKTGPLMGLLSRSESIAPEVGEESQRDDLGRQDIPSSTVLMVRPLVRHSIGVDFNRGRGSQQYNR